MRVKAFIKKLFHLHSRQKSAPMSQYAGFSSPSRYEIFKKRYLPYIVMVVLLMGIAITTSLTQEQQEGR